MARLTQLSRAVLFVGVAIYLLLPIAAIVLYSLATSWTAHALPDGYTLQHWVEGFADQRLIAPWGAHSSWPWA